jgi:hypothetical protein
VNGRYHNGGRRRPPHHLRIVIPVTQPPDGALPPPLPPGYMAEVLDGVVSNLLRDANTVTGAAMNAVVDEMAGHGLELRPMQFAAIRRAVFAFVVGALRRRLLEGLSDGGGLSADDADDTSEPRMGEHLVKGMPPAGDLMQLFRETLMSEESDGNDRTS